MNTDLFFSSNTDMWSTPQDFFDKMNTLYKFSTDVCATADNAKCKEFYTPEMNGLIQDWKGVCWMNPPYGRGIGKWIAKAYRESIIEKKCVVVALLPARTDTKWFHDYIYEMPGVKVDFIKGRLKFGGSIYNAPFPCMVVYFNTDRHNQNNIL